MQQAEQQAFYLAAAGHRGGAFAVLGVFPDYQSAHARLCAFVSDRGGKSWKDLANGWYHVERQYIAATAG